MTTPFTDSFDNESNKYASTKTLRGGAKFLSFDDVAFTLNCKEGEEFYRNLGIGDRSKRRIFFPRDEVITISGLNWLFMDMSHSKTKFDKPGRGIYDRLYKNYSYIDSKGVTYKNRAQLKVFCYQWEQQKLEILIDENMTMDKMNRLFDGVEKKTIPANAFEVLIEETKSEKDGKKVIIWNDYIYAVRNFLAEIRIPESYLLKIFTKRLRSKIIEWVRDESSKEQSEFFKKTDFCIKCLCMSTTIKSIMSPGEEYAFAVGQISRHYVDFKVKIGEKSNSLKDILTYSKYDREKLRFVLKRIGIGINLAKADISTITNTVTTLLQEEEIADEEAHKDYSYFFYKGYYTKEKIA